MKMLGALTLLLAGDACAYRSMPQYSHATFQWNGHDPSARKELCSHCGTPTSHDLYSGRDPNRARIFDTTLRDGEQSPGCTMTVDEKIAVAVQLAKLGVDVIEAGFPASSKGDFDAVSQIARIVGSGENNGYIPIICGLARTVKGDIDACAAALVNAKFPRIHVFISTSDVHMEHKLRKSRREVLKIITNMVRYAAGLFSDVEFSAEDALRSEPEFLYEAYSTAIAAGATTINVPDTVGYATPAEFKQLIQGIRHHVRGVENVTISVHGHNDLGLAVANFLAAVEGGARQLECTINGIGERAGNAALEELAMVLHVRQAYYNPFFGRDPRSEVPLTSIHLSEIAQTSRLVSSITGLAVQSNKAIVGANAFAHESGIHQDGVLKNRRTYEIMDADSIGLSKNNIVLGKHSGRHAFRSRLVELGHTLSDAELNAAFVRFKELGDRKKRISTADIEAIVMDELQAASRNRYLLRQVQVQCGSGQIATATVTVVDREKTGVQRIADAGEPLIPATRQGLQLLEYAVTSVTAGIDALGEVTVRCKEPLQERVGVGRATNTDIMVASAQAYVAWCPDGPFSI